MPLSGPEGFEGIDRRTDEGFEDEFGDFCGDAVKKIIATLPATDNYSKETSFGEFSSCFHS